MKNFVLRLIFSKAGPTVTAAVSAAVGFIVSYVVQFFGLLNIQMDAEAQTQLSLALSYGFYWLLQQLINRYAGEYAATLQEAVGVQKDRWIGPETIAAVQAKAQAAAANPATGKIYEGKPVAPEPKKETVKPKRKPKNPITTFKR